MADQGAEGILSPFLRKKRFQAAKKYLKGRVLDVGCGSGGLSRFVNADSYHGVEKDEESLAIAKKQHPNIIFSRNIGEIDGFFDTVVSLAVIEHVPSPSQFLLELSQMLKDENGRIVVTTPHPSVDWVHGLGASIGLFSKHANDEHEDLLNQETLRQAGDQAGLQMVVYERFLLGANQLAVFSRKSVESNLLQ